MTSFVKQFDYGIAPAAHASSLLDKGHPEAEGEVLNVFLPQVSKGWIDLVAIGWVVQGNTTVDARFLFDTASGNFVPNLPAAGTHSLSNLATLARQDKARLAGNG